MLSGVSIRGEGVSARCCARLLARAGLPVFAEGGPRPRLPAIMLGETAQKLLCDILDRPDLFQRLPRICKRIVAWGSNAEPLVLPHAAVVVSELELLERMQAEPRPEEAVPAAVAGWTILASRPLPESSQEFQFGSRAATASAVKLKAGSETGACWIESLESGWLFLLPGGDGGWLLSVGGAADSLLGQSRVIAEQVAEGRGTGGVFSSHPRITEPLGGPGWLACGTAAMSFDPLCGDGAGNATREAILASAVIHAIADGADVNSVVAHYQTRLLAGFKRHIEVCQEFYRSGGSGPWWQEQAGATQRGLEWCASKLSNVAGFRYRLNGFSLQAID